MIGNFSAKTTEATDMRKGKQVALKIHNKLVKMGVDVSKIKCLGGDSTNLNTGVRNGIIAQLELLWGHKVEWVTCLYHIGELPMKKLLSELDGETKSPDSYKGISGQCTINDFYLNLYLAYAITLTRDRQSLCPKNFLPILFP